MGGVVFKGKSGWCSSHLSAAAGPAHLRADARSPPSPTRTASRAWAAPRTATTSTRASPIWLTCTRTTATTPATRKFFVGCFPGLILCYFTLPEHISAARDYGRFALYIAASAGSFFLAEALLKVTVNKITAVYGAVAISLFYWYPRPRCSPARSPARDDGVVRVGAARRGVGARRGVARAHLAQGGRRSSSRPARRRPCASAGRRSTPRAPSRRATPRSPSSRAACAWWPSPERRCSISPRAPSRRSRRAAAWASAGPTRCASSRAWRTSRRSPATSRPRSIASAMPRTRAWPAARASTGRSRSRSRPSGRGASAAAKRVEGFQFDPE